MLENVLGAGVTSPDSPRLMTHTHAETAQRWWGVGVGGKQEALSMIQRSGFLKVKGKLGKIPDFQRFSGSSWTIEPLLSVEGGQVGQTGVRVGIQGPVAERPPPWQAPRALKD